MKKILSFVIIFVFIFTSCEKKRERLTNNTFSIAIDPATAVNTYTGNSVHLKAICKNAQTDNLNVNPVWSVVNNIGTSSLGTFTPSTGSSTTFKAGTSPGSGKIYVMYGNTQSFVNLNVSLSGGGLQHILFSDSIVSSLLTKDSGGNVKFNYFDTDNTTPWQITTQNAAPGCPVDSLSSMKVSYTNSSIGYGGFYLEFSSPQDLSANSKLSFYAKGQNGGEKFLVKINDGSDRTVAIDNTKYSLTTAWSEIEIPFSDFVGLNSASISKPFIIAFTDADTQGNATIYLDYIGFK